MRSALLVTHKAPQAYQSFAAALLVRLSRASEFWADIEALDSRHTLFDFDPSTVVLEKEVVISPAAPSLYVFGEFDPDEQGCIFQMKWKVIRAGSAAVSVLSNNGQGVTTLFDHDLTFGADGSVAVPLTWNQGEYNSGLQFKFVGTTSVPAGLSVTITAKAPPRYDLEAAVSRVRSSPAASAIFSDVKNEELRAKFLTEFHRSSRVDCTLSAVLAAYAHSFE